MFFKKFLMFCYIIISIEKNFNKPNVHLRTLRSIRWNKFEIKEIEHIRRKYVLSK